MDRWLAAHGDAPTPEALADELRAILEDARVADAAALATMKLNELALRLIQLRTWDWAAEHGKVGIRLEWAIKSVGPVGVVSAEARRALPALWRSSH